VVFGALAERRLVGVAGFLASQENKRRHWGVLWGVFLRPEWRGRGLGALLVGRGVEHATEHVLILQTSVVTVNHKARRTYARLGFVPYGTERRALLIDGRFYDEELLALELGKDPAVVA
jgi:RimJ/RimL family protein N-acetyltransferase